MNDVPRRIRIMTNCPNCGGTSDADPEFVKALVNAGKLRDAEVHIIRAEAAYRRQRRLRSGTIISFAILAGVSVANAGWLWFNPRPVDPAELVVANMIIAVAAYCAAYIAWTWK